MQYNYDNTFLGKYERVTDTHVYFVGGPFSQWAYSKFRCEYHKKTFSSCEQYMMWQKAMMFDESMAEKILKETDPKTIKQMGREIKNFDDYIWTQDKYKIVRQGNLMKFSQNKNLFKILMDAGDRTFVEAATYDRIWGVGLGQDDDRILDENNWLGANLLGKAITEVSKHLREKETNEN